MLFLEQFSFRIHETWTNKHDKSSASNHYYYYTLLSPPTYFPLLGMYNALKYLPKSATFWEIILASLEDILVELKKLHHFSHF